MQSPVANRRLILLLGYWPPTDAGNILAGYATRHPYRNGGGELTGYDVLAISAEFTQLGWTHNPADPAAPIPFWGRGEGDFPVDYRQTSLDFWRIIPELDPVAIMSFSRTRPDDEFAWVLEPHARNLCNWTATGADGDTWLDCLRYFTGDPATAERHAYPYEPPYVGGSAEDPANAPGLPNYGCTVRGGWPPDATQPAGYTRESTLPMREICAAINGCSAGVAGIRTERSIGTFCSAFMGYHVAWYQSFFLSHCRCAGHTHIKPTVSAGEGANYLRLQLDALIAWLE